MVIWLQTLGISTLADRLVSENQIISRCDFM